MHITKPACIVKKCDSTPLRVVLTRTHRIRSTLSFVPELTRSLVTVVDPHR